MRRARCCARGRRVIERARLCQAASAGAPVQQKIEHFQQRASRKHRALADETNASEGEREVTDEPATVSGVAERYASALFELSRDEGTLDAVMADLDRFAALLAGSPDLARLVRSPVFTPEDQLRAIGAVLDRAGISGTVANFIRLAARNRRLFATPDMIVAFRRFLAEHRGEATAEVTSAEPLSPAHEAALREALGASTGKTVRIHSKVDPALIGGLVVKIGSRMIDTSLRTKLNSLRIALKEVG